MWHFEFGIFKFSLHFWLLLILSRSYWDACQFPKCSDMISSYSHNKLLFCSFFMAIIHRSYWRHGGDLAKATQTTLEPGLGFRSVDSQPSSFPLGHSVPLLPCGQAKARLSLKVSKYHHLLPRVFPDETDGNNWQLSVVLFCLYRTETQQIAGSVVCLCWSKNGFYIFKGYEIRKRKRRKRKRRRKSKRRRVIETYVWPIQSQLFFIWPSIESLPALVYSCIFLYLLKNFIHPQFVFMKPIFVIYWFI